MLVERALQAGADAAEAIVFEGQSLGVSWRLGKLEDVERSEGRDVGLRVFIGSRQAVVSTTDLSERSLGPLVERVVAMARVAPEDPYAGLADPDLLASSWPDLEIDDPSSAPTAEALAASAAEAEEAALAVKGVTNSGGAGAQWGRSGMALVTSGGFSGAYSGTSFSVSCSVLAGEGTRMERDYDYSSARHLADLDAPARIGRSAGERAVRRLDPRKVRSQAVPIVYDPRVSAGLVGHFAGAISGAAITRKTSFLQHAMGKPVFAPGIEIVDDPHRKRGLRSKPFDGEGVRNRAMKLIENGTLTTWLLDTASARQLGLRSTGHAARGAGGPPSPSTTNLYMAPGKLSPEALIADIQQGLYVTELIGMGVNGVTGDYSRGASGFWIENGKIGFPVSEITVAGNLKEMFLHMTPANDLVFRYATNAPTIRVEGMTVAGM
ncbi:MAG TPA: metallopeptidase TldD-related protein [Parvibaculum sp.]|uniref:TldD/PmbA family protein n=1 Tax=Parvibaculum sp. TaxID=2024848 RepID=UPI002C4E3659|nr:metallopeptidase TldD-related protein [Parvibaculum sp.]HMM13305.1 metallopeptidase TldD-related protein [Parvibaculum sp.]